MSSKTLSDDGKAAPKFMGIIGHENVSHNGSKTTVYHLQVQLDNVMYVVHHRYHEFKDFYDRVRVCPWLDLRTTTNTSLVVSLRPMATSVQPCRRRSSLARSTRNSLRSDSKNSRSGCICFAHGMRRHRSQTHGVRSTIASSYSPTYVLSLHFNSFSGFLT